MFTAGACGAAVCVFSLAAPAHAQSLGDVAKKEEARRKTIADPAKVLTNTDLRPTADAQQGVADAAPAAPAADGDKKPAAAAAKPDAKDAPKDEAYWRKR